MATKRGSSSAGPGGEPPVGLDVRKTYKLFLGGEFVRSESGRYDPVVDRQGRVLANICRASRKDLRDAVRRAREAQGGWASKTAYLKGQILYRMAEMLEGRAADFESLLRRDGRATAAQARSEVRAAIDRLVHYAGWSDKFPALLSSVNPVASHYFDFSLPEPMGVVGLVAPDEPPLLGLVSHLAPALVAGNAVVALLSETRPLAALEFAEVLATSDLPAGVVALLSGRREELLPHLARHMDVNAILEAGAPEDLSIELQRDAAVNVKRVRIYRVGDYHANRQAQGLGFVSDVLEIKTTWHPVGW